MDSSLERSRYFSLPLIDMSIFENFDMSNAASWSLIELWCALNGVEIDNNLFCFFLCGMAVSSNIRKIMIDVILNSDKCNEAMNNLNTLKCLVAIASKNNNSYIKSEVFAKWNDLNSGFDIEAFEFTKKELFKILKKIDERCPLLLVEYYDKNKSLMYLYDRDMAEFILRLTSQKAKISLMFKRVYEVMLDDKVKYENISMFMN